MGITYPKSLEIYDLKLRYTTANSITITCLEQDIGRVCRYKDDDLKQYPLPTVFVSNVCKDTIMSIRNPKPGEEKTETIFVPPANSEKMFCTKNKSSQYPRHAVNLRYYQENFLPGKKNIDNTNEILNKFKNRFLLYGRPQCGKTGSFLELIYQIWQKIKSTAIGKLSNVSEIVYDSDIEEEDDDSEIKDEDENLSTLTPNKILDDLNSYDFPPFHIMKDWKLSPKYPPPSSRYGDPKLREDRDHYIIHKKTYPPERLLKQQYNSLIKRMEDISGSSSDINFPCTSAVTEEKNSSDNTSCKVFRSEATRFGSRKLTIPNVETDDFLLYDYKSKYNLYTFPFGTLHLNKQRKDAKWLFNKFNHPSINPSITHIPIVICSSGRSTTGLFDLTKAMNGQKLYIQIVVIREEEEYDYLSLTNHYPNIDVLVLPKGTPHKIGASRMRAKEMSEALLKDYVFFMDDNIRGWSRISFQDDDHNDETCTKGVIDEDISLLSLLDYFRQYSREMEKFAIIGFQFSKRGIKTCKQAYSRKHVYGAVILNLKKTKTIHYDEAWAMEDINFNLKLNECWNSNRHEGVIVKFQRFVASKKSIKSGGVVPYDVPPHLMELIKHSKHWNNNIKETARVKENEENNKMYQTKKGSAADDVEKKSGHNVKRKKEEDNSPRTHKHSKRRKSDYQSPNNEAKQCDKDKVDLRKELEKLKRENKNTKEDLERTQEQKYDIQKELQNAYKEIMHLKDNHKQEMMNMRKRFEKENEENKIKLDKVIEENDLMRKDLANTNQENEELRRNIMKNKEIYFEGVKKLEKENREEKEKIRLLHQEEIDRLKKKQQIENLEIFGENKKLKEKLEDREDSISKLIKRLPELNQ